MKNKNDTVLAVIWSAATVISFLNACMCLWLVLQFYKMGWLVW